MPIGRDKHAWLQLIENARVKRSHFPQADHAAFSFPDLMCPCDLAKILAPCSAWHPLLFWPHNPKFAIRCRP